jgi:hypothetical protein
MTNTSQNGAPGAEQEAQAQFQEMMVKSATDADFRQRLLTSPREVLEELGADVPESLEIRFIENQADATIVLPDIIDPSAELSDHELEAVAGGWVWTIIPLTSFVVSLIKGHHDHQQHTS